MSNNSSLRVATLGLQSFVLGSTNAYRIMAVGQGVGNRKPSLLLIVHKNRPYEDCNTLTGAIS